MNIIVAHNSSCLKFGVCNVIATRRLLKILGANAAEYARALTCRSVATRLIINRLNRLLWPLRLFLFSQNKRYIASMTVCICTIGENDGK